MERKTGTGSDERAVESAEAYEPPALTQLGSLAELTQQKEVGASDGTTFLGLQIGS